MRRSPALLACLWLVTGAAWAEPAASPAPAAASPPVGNVVITARRPKPEPPPTYRQEVRKFVQEEGRPGPFGLISRWEQPLCPKAAGLSPALNQFVEHRIGEIAARVGARVRADCPRDANVLVVFTTEPDRLMADVRDRHPALLGFHFIGETRSVSAFEPPMKSWYVTMTSVPGAFAMFDQAYAPGPPETGSGSRIHLPLHSGFALALIVVDPSRLEGREIGQVADRIAMLALSRPARHAGCSALPSVMDVLDPACGSNSDDHGLTSYDEAYLKALYATDLGEPRGYERDLMARRILKEGAPPAASPPR